MKASSRLWVLGVLLLSSAVNALFFLPNAWKAGVSYITFRGLSNPERRYLQRGNWYRAVLAAESQMPLDASVRYVSPAPAWYLAYYFYPRLLKKGSTDLRDRDKIRRQYPYEWVLAYSEENPPQMNAYPPLKAGAR